MNQVNLSIITDFIPLLLISFTLICFKEILIGAEQTVFKNEEQCRIQGLCGAKQTNNLGITFFNIIAVQACPQLFDWTIMYQMDHLKYFNL